MIVAALINSKDMLVVSGGLFAVSASKGDRSIVGAAKLDLGVVGAVH